MSNDSNGSTDAGKYPIEPLENPNAPILPYGSARRYTYDDAWVAKSAATSQQLFPSPPPVDPIPHYYPSGLGRIPPQYSSVPPEINSMFRPSSREIADHLPFPDSPTTSPLESVSLSLNVPNSLVPSRSALTSSALIAPAHNAPTRKTFDATDINGNSVAISYMEHADGRLSCPQCPMVATTRNKRNVLKYHFEEVRKSSVHFR